MSAATEMHCNNKIVANKNINHNSNQKSSPEINSFTFYVRLTNVNISDIHERCQDSVDLQRIFRIKFKNIIDNDIFVQCCRTGMSLLAVSPFPIAVMQQKPLNIPPPYPPAADVIKK